MALRYYDATGRRVPSPRRDAVPSGGTTAAVVLVCLTLIAGFGVWAWLCQRPIVEASRRADSLIAHDSMTAIHTYDGETIRFYVMTDPDTQLQYIVNDRGGMCLREFDND